MSKQVGRYPDKTRKEAAIAYAINGNMSQVARDMNINVNTLKSWSDSDLWVDTIADVHQAKASEHRAMYSKVVDAAQRQTLATIDSATPAQASLIACQATDKVRLLDNMPTSITSKTETMTDLAKQFQALARDIKAKTVQVIDITPDKAPLKDPGRGQK